MSELPEEKKENAAAADGLVPAEVAQRELTLALIYLNAFFYGDARKERLPLTAWKTFDFSVLDGLADAKLIYDKHGWKSVTLSRAGIEKAREILAKYGVAEWPNFPKQEHIDAYYKP